jgi:hypothetical protein
MAKQGGNDDRSGPNDHDPPHFHAEGADFSARVAIDDGSIINHVGKMSASSRRLLTAWAATHRDIN